MSIEYTAEDFAQATFARHENGRKAVRFEGGVNASVPSPPWQVGRFGVATDEVMAAEGGWAPVVESRITERTLRDSQEKAERNRQGLVDHIQELDAVIRRRNKEIKELRALRDELRTSVDELHAKIRELEARPITLDSLAAAWETAEVSGECREGDVLISKSWNGADDFRAYSAKSAIGLPPGLRILSRAPREPWANLGDKLAIEMPGIEHEGLIEPLARALYCEHGVRVTGGGEK